MVKSSVVLRGKALTSSDLGLAIHFSSLTSAICGTVIANNKMRSGPVVLTIVIVLYRLGQGRIGLQEKNGQLILQTP